MKPWTTLATAPGSDGSLLQLQSRDGEYVIRVGGRELMSSARHGSEEAMAEAGLRNLASTRPHVLIGGLGLGYTLRAALDRLPPEALVIVAEISEALVTWNQGPLATLTNSPLKDSRVRIEITDVAQLARKPRIRYDAILLDVDNGPSALSRKANQQLYGVAGLRVFREALVPNGVLVVWSAGPDPRFLQRLRLCGFAAEARAVKTRQSIGLRHTLFVARRPQRGGGSAGQE